MSYRALWPPEKPQEALERETDTGTSTSSPKRLEGLTAFFHKVWKKYLIFSLLDPLNLFSLPFPT
jgi:hypothetical protein